MAKENERTLSIINFMTVIHCLTFLAVLLGNNVQVPSAMLDQLDIGALCCQDKDFVTLLIHRSIVGDPGACGSIKAWLASFVQHGNAKLHFKLDDLPVLLYLNLNPEK